MNEICFNLRAGQKICYEIKEVMTDVKTRFQHIQICKTTPFGKMVFVDGLPQSSDVDEALFNEILAHSSISRVKNAKRVFIAGGGPGGVLREALKYPDIEEVVLCDLDEEAVTCYRKHLSDWNSLAYADKRTTLVHEDARSFLENDSRPFDVIIIDVPDPLENGTTQGLFTQEFYKLCWNKLTDEGVFCTQSGRADFDNFSYYSSVYTTLSSVFKGVTSYATYIPCYSEHWSFTTGQKRKLQMQEDFPSGVNFVTSENLKTWSALAAIFSLKDERIKNTVYTDKNPLIIK